MNIKKFNQLFKNIVDQKTGRTFQTWLTCFNHWQTYSDKNIGRGFEELVRGFEDELKQKCSHNTVVTYWSKFRNVFMIAIDNGIIRQTKIPKITAVETHRTHLTLSELRQLSETPCQSNKVKRMALFSALTGLRWSDVSQLDYTMLLKTDYGHKIEFTQQKTGNIESLPISEQAVRILTDQKRENQETGESGQKFFEIGYSSYIGRILKKWKTDAGIDREITFHAFRHTMAVLQLESGTDIYTVSKMLGHRNIKTTEVYARISDRAKIEAANRIVI